MAEVGLLYTLFALTTFGHCWRDLNKRARADVKGAFKSGVAAVGWPAYWIVFHGFLPTMSRALSGAIALIVKLNRAFNAAEGYVLSVYGIGGLSTFVWYVELNGVTGFWGVVGNVLLAILAGLSWPGYWLLH